MSALHAGRELLWPQSTARMMRWRGLLKANEQQVNIQGAEAMDPELWNSLSGCSLLTVETLTHPTRVLRQLLKRGCLSNKITTVPDRNNT